MSVSAPPEDDLKMMEWGWGEQAARAFTGVRPLDVDRRSPGFFAATPLMDLPPRAAAAYLGTYLLSLLESLSFQDSVGLFDDIVTRAHTVTCMTDKVFWDRVVMSHLSASCRAATRDVARCMADNAEELALEPEQVEALRRLSADP